MRDVPLDKARVYAPKVCPQCLREFVPPPNSYHQQKHCSVPCGHASRTHTPEQAVAAFWRKVDKSAGDNGCWIWMGCRNQWNYGLGKIRTKSFQAHRQSYEWAHGPIPDGMLVLHRCDNPPCCNPAHLWLGTNADNKADCVSKDRQSRGERSIHAKLTEAQVIEIRSAQGTATQRVIADKYGVTQSAIASIHKRRSWKYL